MNDNKVDNIIKPKSTELDNEESKCKVFSFESNNSKVFTFENGELKEKNECHTFTKGNENGSITETTEKNTQFVQQAGDNLKPVTTTKKTTTVNNFNGSDSATPFNTPNQQYQSIGDNSNPVDFSKFKQGIENLKDPKKEELKNLPQEQNQPQSDTGTGLRHLNKNPNVGNEQYFTSFQKYVPKEGEESLPTSTNIKK